MASEYNSQLIDDLYAATDYGKAADIVGEMNEVKDPIFVYPILNAYNRFKKTPTSHYFISGLKEYSSPEVAEIIKNIALDSETKIGDVIWTLGYLIKIGFIDKQILDKLDEYLEHGLEKADIPEYYMRDICEYFIAAGILPQYENVFIAIFEDDEQNKDVRRISLEYLFKLDAKKVVQHYLDNYEVIKRKGSEIIFARVISTWRGTIIITMQDKILAEGGSKSQEIIKEARAIELKASAKEKGTPKAVKISNSGLISEIAGMRRKINSLMQADYNFALFLDSELIYDQNEAAQDLPALKSSALDLRTFIQLLSENLLDHKFDLAAAGKIISGVTKETMNLSLNRLELYLVSRNKDAGEGLFGLRSLNNLLNKLAHSTESDLVNTLKELGLYELYRSENWQALHKKILEMYRDSLVGLQKSLSN